MRWIDGKDGSACCRTWFWCGVTHGGENSVMDNIYLNWKLALLIVRFILRRFVILYNVIFVIHFEFKLRLLVKNDALG